MTNPALEYRQVCKDYRVGFSRQRVRALDGFSLQVYPGEIFGFLGPNGAGKTTAIHLAIGFMRATSGSGSLLANPFGDARTRKRVGFLAESVALSSRSAVSLLEFYANLNGVPDPRRRALEALDRVGLLDIASRTSMKLSRGMQQRLGIAQAIINDPELLILDEPTSALDPVARVFIRELLVELRAAGKTVFMSSHILSEIEAICDRIGVLRKGKLVGLGRMSDLLQTAERCSIVARGVSANHFPGAVQNDGLMSLEVERSTQKQILERIWTLGGDVISVNPVRESMEEMFLRLTGTSPGDVHVGATHREPNP